MRSALIKTAIAISIMASFSPQIAFAIVSPSFSCSSNLVVSLDNGYSASCDGDFSFTEGLLENDISINLTASGLLNIGANASLNAPFISLNSKDVFLAGILKAPGGQIKIDSTNSPVVGASSKINVAGNSIIQIAPITIVDWNNLNIEPGRGSKAPTALLPRIVQTEPSGELTIGSAIVSTEGIIRGSGISVQSYQPTQGGTLVLRPSNGILISNSGLAALENPNITLVSQVPEPSTYMMMILGLISLGFTRKTKRA